MDYLIWVLVAIAAVVCVFKLLQAAIVKKEVETDMKKWKQQRYDKWERENQKATRVDKMIEWKGNFFSLNEKLVPPMQKGDQAWMLDRHGRRIAAFIADTTVDLIESNWTFEEEDDTK